MDRLRDGPYRAAMRARGGMVAVALAAGLLTTTPAQAADEPTWVSVGDVTIAEQVYVAPRGVGAEGYLLLEVPITLDRPATGYVSVSWHLAPATTGPLDVC